MTCVQCESDCPVWVLVADYRSDPKDHQPDDQNHPAWPNCQAVRVKQGVQWNPTVWIYQIVHWDLTARIYPTVWIYPTVQYDPTVTSYPLESRLQARGRLGRNTCPQGTQSCPGKPLGQ